LWFHYGLIVITQIGDRTLAASWTLEDADALPMPQQRLVEIVDGAGVLRKQGLQEIVGCLCRHLLSDEAKTYAHAVNVHVYP